MVGRSGEKRNMSAVLLAEIVASLLLTVLDEDKQTVETPVFLIVVSGENTTL